jgi:hypothetical protein
MMWSGKTLSFFLPSILLIRKRPGHEVDRALPVNAKFKNGWSYTSTPPTCLHGVDWENFIFFLTFYTVNKKVARA